MGKKLYVGNIPAQATEADLTELFSKIAGVESAKIITDLQTGRSRGFGFVEMSTDSDAEKAITELNGASFMDSAIVVNEARPQRQREKRRFGGGRGGFDRGRGNFNRGKGSGFRKGRR